LQRKHFAFFARKNPAHFFEQERLGRSGLQRQTSR
jgi:hypothetical protein